MCYNLINRYASIGSTYRKEEMLCLKQIKN
nr:MAG TPA: hypothetical protein [Caudoviricetes sp.]